MDLFLACKPHMSAAPLVAYAWGVDERTIHRVYEKMLCDENGEPTGVEILSCFDDSPDNGSGDGGENHNSNTTQQQKTLWYKKPDVGDQQLKENLVRMTSDELKLLFHQLPQSHPWFNCVLDAFIAREHAELSDDEEGAA